MSASYTMALNSTPIRIVTMPTGIPRTKVYLTNESQTGDIFIGDPNVSENAGYLITKQTGSGVSYRAEFELFAGQELWAVCRAGATGSIHIGYSA